MPKDPTFYLFFDPFRGGRTLGAGRKVGFALTVGVGFALLDFLAMQDKSAFYEQSCWVLSVVISTSILAVFIATTLLRGSLKMINELTGSKSMSERVTAKWLSDRAFLLAGVCFAAANIGVVTIFGVPHEFHATLFSRSTLFLGYCISGFTAGLGLWAILGVIVLYLSFIPSLQHSLDPDNADGLGGIKRLSDALWFFSMLTATLGVLISVYLFSVDWTSLSGQATRMLFLGWLALPYIVAISIVLIPGLAMRRQVGEFKNYRSQQLRLERARLYSSYKKFNAGDDEEIISQKRDIKERLNRIQTQIENLRRMRQSQLDLPRRD